MQTIATSPARQTASAFGAHQRIALAMIGAPLGMADDDGCGAGIRQHFRRNIAGVRAGGLGMAILRPDGERLAPFALSAKAATSVAGGQTRRSALAATAAAPASMASNSPNEAFRPFIFQLPAISGRMASVMSNSQSHSSNAALAERDAQFQIGSDLSRSFDPPSISEA